MMKILIFAVMVSIGFFAVLPDVCLSYETDIRADAEEIYAAALKALESYGIETADAVEKTIETKWVTDVSERKKSVFGFKMKKKYERKHRIKIRISEIERFTHVSVKAQFLFRQADASGQTPWRTLKTTREDDNLEKQVFQRILAQVEYQRTHPAR